MSAATLSQAQEGDIVKITTEADEELVGEVLDRAPVANGEGVALEVFPNDESEIRLPQYVFVDAGEMRKRLTDGSAGLNGKPIRDAELL